MALADAYNMKDEPELKIEDDNSSFWWNVESDAMAAAMAGDSREQIIEAIAYRAELDENDPELIDIVDSALKEYRVGGYGDDAIY